ncbi:MAG: type II secretion system F family protein [Armatimonadetes bacterium]|nr:type II secretion system F family protein [Armatimonadota bacterium]
MTSFAYTAIDEQGRETSGVLQAESRVAALARLQSQGIYAMTVESALAAGSAATAAAGARAAGIPTLRRRGRRISGADLAVFTRQLASLFNAGLSVARCLDTLIDHSENGRLVAILEQVRRAVGGGSSLWEALAEHPRVFSELYVNLVRAGEASGQLGKVLDRLADALEAQQEYRSRIRAALAYPLLLMASSALVIAFVFAFLVPRFQAIFRTLGHQLPLPTQVSLAVSGFTGRYGLWVLAALAIAMVAARMADRTEAGGLFLDRLRMRLPILGSLAHKDALSRFCRTLSTLLGGGVPILTSFEVAERAVGNRVLRQAIGQVRSAVREGENLAVPLQRSGAFPALVTNMVAVGEETGNLEEMLRRIADAYDAELQNRTRQLLSLFEPGIILLMGLIVGSIVISMLLPVLQLSTAF